MSDVHGDHMNKVIPVAKTVKILPFDDTIESGVFKTHLESYFKSTYKPLGKGYTFYVNCPHLVKFKVIEIDPVETEYCIVGSDTVIHVDDESITVHDLGGVRKQIYIIKDMVQSSLKCPKLHKTFGVKPIMSVLLHGLPGTGKTMIAHAVANEVGGFFFPINCTEIMSMNVGDAEERLRSAFKEAKTHSPAIIFIDELDSIASNRENTNGEFEHRIVSMLSTLMDEKHQIFVIGTTNTLDLLDPVLHRFKCKIEIGVPDEEGRIEILNIHTKKLKLDPKINIQQISQQTKGFVGADLALLCIETAQQCIREQMKFNDIDDHINDAKLLASMTVSQDHFMAAMNMFKTSVLPSTVVQVPKADVGGCIAEERTD